jgi:hypothetical protein
MNKFWRLAAILLVVVVACSDKKAETAAALKTEIEGLLAKAAGPDKKNITYGDVTVTPGDADAYTVTIDKLTVPLPDAQPLDLGKVGFKLTPDGDDMRKFSDLVLPSSLKVLGSDGKEEGTINLVLDHGTGSWSKSLGTLLNIDLLAKSLDVAETSTGDTASLLGTSYVVTTDDKGSGVYDQKGSFGIKQLKIGGKDVNVTANDIAATSNIGSIKLAEFIAAEQEWKKAAESGKASQMLPTLMKMAALVKSMHGSINIGALTGGEGGQTLFSLGSFGFDFGIEGIDQPKSNLFTGLRFAGLASPNLTQLAGPAASEMLPSDFGIKLTMNDVPVPAAIELAGKSMGDASVTDENAMMGASMMMAGALEAALAQAGTKIGISDGTLSAPGVNGKFGGSAVADKAAAMGATADIDVTLSDLDALIAKVSSHADDPSAQEIVGTLQMLKSMSDRGTDSAGKPTDHFKITMDAQGETLINGKPFQPTAAP